MLTCVISNFYVIIIIMFYFEIVSYIVFVRPEKFQFPEKRKNRNFDYKIVISVKNMEFIL